MLTPHYVRQTRARPRLRLPASGDAGFTFRSPPGRSARHHRPLLLSPTTPLSNTRAPRHYPLFSVHENHIVFRVVKRSGIICYWRILGTLAKVANRIPRWDATEGILWGNLMACPAWKVGLATCTASPWPSRRFHDGKRFAGSLSGIMERMIRVSEINCPTGDPKYICCVYPIMNCRRCYK